MSYAGNSNGARVERWRQGQGLTDKLYWRRTRRGWHVFKRAGSRWEALCDAALALDASDGQDSRRPPSVLRCPRCDGLEAARRGWEECGDEHVDFAAARAFPMLPLVK